MPMHGYVVGGSGPATRCRWNLGEPLRLRLRYTTFPRLPDRTVIRLSLPGAAFGIAVEDILARGCVYVPASGVFATTDPPRVDLASYRKSIAGRRTILEQVRALPDQSFEHARQVLLNPASNRDPILLSLACDNRKLTLQRGGTAQWQGYELAPHFGSGKGEGFPRRPEAGWMPISVATRREGAIVYGQRTFVAPLDREPIPGRPAWQSRRPRGSRAA